ncbi:MAG: hypothetical protein JXR83_21500 [Deltaproteobacteria bacterium]|nr:hypothetical protein [Deltaproteobacteria bacterium]
MPRAVARRLGPLLLLATIGCPQESIQRLEIRPTPEQFFPFNRKGQAMPFTAHVLDKNNFLIAVDTATWKSSDESVITVDVSGKVTAIGSGTAQLQAEYKGFTAAIPISVTIIGKVELSPATDITIKMRQTQQFSAVVKDDHGQVVPDHKVVWSMMGYAADVDQTGLVRGQAIGESVLQAKAGDEVARVKINVLDWE